MWDEFTVGTEVLNDRDGGLWRCYRVWKGVGRNSLMWTVQITPTYIFQRVKDQQGTETCAGCIIILRISISGISVTHDKGKIVRCSSPA
jgi:hypothetical protein